MSEKITPRFLTVTAIINDHGGEIPFWSLWLARELDPRVMAFVQEHAATHPNAPRWLAVVGSPQAQRARAVALEIVNFLVEDSAPPTESSGEEITDIVNHIESESGCPPVRERLRQCL